MAHDQAEEGHHVDVPEVTVKGRRYVKREGPQWYRVIRDAAVRPPLEFFGLITSEPMNDALDEIARLS